MNIDPHIADLMHSTGYTPLSHHHELSGTTLAPRLSSAGGTRRLNNSEIAAAVAGMKLTIESDKHGGARDFVLSKLLDAGIIDEMPVSALNPFRSCPGDWTAIQVAYFDNGEPTQRRKRYTLGKDGQRRERIQRTKMRFGGNIKVWTQENINFQKPMGISWQANFHCWNREEARNIARDLSEEGYIDESTLFRMTELTEEAGCRLRFSIPLLKTTEGTRWMKEHIVITVLDESGQPETVGLDFPELEIVTKEPLATTLPNGDPFGLKVVRPASVEPEILVHGRRQSNLNLRVRTERDCQS